jgi:hypothetical protein
MVTAEVTERQAHRQRDKAVNRIRERFPTMIVYLIAPPKRLSVARDLGKCCNGVGELTAGRLFQHLLPAEIRDQKGKRIATRPAKYAPYGE